MNFFEYMIARSTYDEIKETKRIPLWLIWWILFLLIGIFIPTIMIFNFGTTWHFLVNLTPNLIQEHYLLFSAISSFLIAYKLHKLQMQNNSQIKYDLARVIILKTDNKQDAIDIINELQHIDNIKDKDFKKMVKKYPGSQITSRKKDGYKELHLWTPEISNVIKTINNNKQLYDKVIEWNYNNKMIYFVLYLVDKQIFENKNKV